MFVEAVIAPGFEPEAKKALAKKPNVRVMDMDTTSIHKVSGFDLRRIMGGLLAQEWDLHRIERDKCEVVTKRGYPVVVKPSGDERQCGGHGGGLRRRCGFDPGGPGGCRPRRRGAGVRRGTVAVARGE